MLIGLQASGKTTFYRQRLARTHTHVSKDAFPNARHPQRRQLRLIDAARAQDARVVGYWFPPDLAASMARNATRNARTRVPEVGLYATIKILRRPTGEYVRTQLSGAEKV